MTRAKIGIIGDGNAAVDDALRELGEGINGKTIVDVTNAFDA